jgi:hypothetical protein
LPSRTARVRAAKSRSFTQTKCLEQAKTGTVEKSDHELRRPFEPTENFANLVARHHYRQFSRLSGAHHIVESGQRIAEDMLVQEEERAESLRLGRRGDVLAHHKMGQKCVDLLGSHCRRVSLVVKENESVRRLY